MNDELDKIRLDQTMTRVTELEVKLEGFLRYHGLKYIETGETFFPLKLVPLCKECGK